MDIEKVRRLLDELAAFMKENELEELAVDVEGAEVKLRKAGKKGQAPVIHHATPPVHTTAGQHPPASHGGPEPQMVEPSEEAGEIVTAPMVGSFYRSPNPEADTFVEVGDPVEPDQVLCIIEAMKVMNEIKAEQAGTVAEILVEDGEPVEYGQPLFRLTVEE